MKRLFIAIDIPSKIIPQIVDIQKQLKFFAGKLTEPENLHLTLKFLGQTKADDEIKIIEKLNEIKFSRFNTQISNIGVFSESFVRIIWLHLKNCEALQKQVDNALQNMFEPEKRFMSHLTIARVKSVSDKQLFFRNLNDIFIPDLDFEVNCFRLKESILYPSGPVYKTVKEFKSLN